MGFSLQTKLKGNITICHDFHTNRFLQADHSLYKFLWQQNGTLSLKIDYIPFELQANEIICLSPLHHIEFNEINGDYTMLLFNSNFYCIFGHDDEVSCNGFLFKGSDRIMRIKLQPEQSEMLQNIKDEIEKEYDVFDTFQEEMLRILLKQFIINCTRIAKKQYDFSMEHEKSFNLLRNFFVLVDEHFKEKKKVQDYAEMLHRSPKTLSNVFSQHNLPTPLQIIRERTLAEAKRLLLYSEKPVKEIAYVLGFNEPSDFSRFFKIMTKHSISNFLKNEHRE
ncbi:MAG: helix-turn-helix domain-containing protein [Bacteroidales bacterium]|nr:helix-turn-helix domain-containing protein [Bacteroidales bacterium]